jgi:hypothetical protein
VTYVVWANVWARLGRVIGSVREIDSEEFFANLRASLGIDIFGRTTTDEWNSIFVGEMPGIFELLAKAARSFPLYAFTNSNREHEQH